MDNGGMFKNTFFGGFKKRDVLSYIDSLSDRARRIEAELKRQLSDVTGQCDLLKEKLAGYERRIADLEAQLKQQKQENRFLNLENKMMQAKLSKAVQQQSGQPDVGGKEALSQEQQLLERIRQLEEKGRKYDEISKNLGSMYIQAHSNAAKLVEQAKDQSEKISQDAEKLVDIIYEDVSGFRQQIDDARQRIINSVHQMEKMLSDIDRVLEQALERFESRNRRVQSNQKTSQLNDKVSESSIIDFADNDKSLSF